MASPKKQPVKDVVHQNVTSRYLKRDTLQELLEQLFPGQKDFNIRMKEDQWCFSAPRKVEDSEIDSIRDQ
ncbi:hypothetical protein B0T25DRAFT_586036 [Lasiosphaeria hispida]|uniref:Uncharacterized protein n=1 Tax=Lasiosphaeria hispida TaxID=260671 RepID=A0AAJ0M8M8_9PEZI|nr:hypothetical protein B0T25DRAFT_586036 [Lasiosphaeria hispida]